jgi:hypothetical protein
MVQQGRQHLTVQIVEYFAPQGHEMWTPLSVYPNGGHGQYHMLSSDLYPPLSSEAGGKNCLFYLATDRGG